jgi:hypothetical protein
MTWDVALWTTGVDGNGTADTVVADSEISEAPVSAASNAARIMGTDPGELLRVE